jgi:Kdo2-lipid IVA lauroyltransferase/acyltransferase
MIRRLADFLISLRDFALTLMVLGVMLPLWVLPWHAACRLGRLYGDVAFVALGEGRRAGMINLRRAFGPSMTRGEARRSVRVVFENLAQSIVEAVQFVRRYKREHGWESLYRIEDSALAERILSDPRPKIFVTGHLGSWEVALLILQRTLGAGAGIARRVDNRWLDLLVKRVRLDHPAQWIEKRGAVEESLARLRRGENIAMLLDENGGPSGPFVEFFGRPASTRKTPAVLSLATGAPIVVGALVRNENSPGFLYRLALIDPRAEGAQAPADIVPLTARITATLESWIRDTPLQWRWIHWRWRTRPDGTTERYGRRELKEEFRI